MLPILYKVFSKLVCERIKAQLISKQSVDQAGFTKGFSTDDHLLVVVRILEAMSEFRTDVWIATIDFRKAFDM
eukprot:1771438-Karenia_brevis.AAC.1